MPRPAQHKSSTANMTGDIANLARDVARPYVRAAIAKYGHLPRGEFEVLITATCVHAMNDLPAEDMTYLKPFFGSYLPAEMMAAYDNLHAPAAGRG
jgi:hypothetical protein